jgi:hypothetical protein
MKRILCGLMVFSSLLLFGCQGGHTTTLPENGNIQLFPNYDHDFKDSAEFSSFIVESFLNNFFDEASESTHFCNNNRYFYGDSFSRDLLDDYDSGICVYSPLYIDDVIYEVESLLDDIFEIDEDFLTGIVREIGNYKYLVEFDQDNLRITYQSALSTKHITFGEISGKKYFSMIEKFFTDRYEWIVYLEGEYILYDQLGAYEREYFYQDYLNDSMTYYKVMVPSTQNDYYLLDLAYGDDNYINEVRYMADDLNDQITLDREKVTLLINPNETSFSYEHNYHYDRLYQDYDLIILNALQLNNWDEIIEKETDDGSVWGYQLYLSDQISYSDFLVMFAPNYDYPQLQMVVSSIDQDFVVATDEYVIPADLLHQLETKIEDYNAEHDSLLTDLGLSIEEITLGDNLQDYLTYLNEYLEFTLDKIKF